MSLKSAALRIIWNSFWNSAPRTINNGATSGPLFQAKLVEPGLMVKLTESYQYWFALRCRQSGYIGFSNVLPNALHAPVDDALSYSAAWFFRDISGNRIGIRLRLCLMGISQDTDSRNFESNRSAQAMEEFS
ncbi:hypothetical protein LOAG_06047 [Loa loa]|uniref:Uncharacterized protein n=1 Tax=Loa loa TaxID=7209 RepID=A0A1S0TYL5_LOALO|nr:hypothetical protein LOAG_06047 [Loa loa]EFO22442.1 hypothetical protein LOAG_06047 [Loa loa]